VGEIGVDGNIILKRILCKLSVVDWIHLIHDRVQWRPLAKTLANLCVS
jgi:hypothetical protein